VVREGTLPHLFFAQAARRGNGLALRHKQLGVWHRVSWTEYAERVKEVAAALLLSGLRRGERVAILGENRPEWLYCHLGTMAAGGVTCGIYPTSSPEQISYLLAHSGARILFLENEEQLEKALLAAAETDLERIVVWDQRGLWGFADRRVTLFEDFRRKGEPAGLREETPVLDPGDVAMTVYTSGTSGPPKGAMLTHRNILFMAQALLDANPVFPEDELISYLPFAHVYENLLSVFLACSSGAVVNFVESPDTLFQNLREISPTLLAGVPRVFEKLASRVELRMQDSTPLKRRAYRWAMGVGRRRAAGEGGAAVSWLAEWAVLRPLRRRLGLDRVRLALCGAAPSSPDLFLYYRTLGVPLLEGYGQTESTGVISVNRMARPRIGTVGEPLPGIEVKIAEDGEILTRGPHVFSGYHKDPELTAQTIDPEGWLRTGDLGRMEEGYLRIVDRKKDIIITSGGRNVTPSNIETELKLSPYVQDAVVIGDRRKYLVALILIDEENVIEYARDHAIPFATFAELTRSHDLERLIRREVDRVNRKLSSAEGIKRFALLPRRFYAEEGDVTPTHKVKRRAVEERYQDLIESLYRE
jgi:long-chain acyl-CoA synthetase